MTGIEAALRDALIRCGRAVGAGLADNVSNEFLLNVPEEVELVVARLARERDEAHPPRDDIIIAWLRQRGFTALADEAEKTFQPAALIPTKPEAGEPELETLRAALRYARPLLVKYAYTQGNSADFVREITAPVDAALQSKKPE